MGRPVTPTRPKAVFDGHLSTLKAKNTSSFDFEVSLRPSGSREGFLVLGGAPLTRRPPRGLMGVRRGGQVLLEGRVAQPFFFFSFLPLFLESDMPGMFDKLTSQVSKSSKGSRTSKTIEIPRTVAFVEQLRKFNTRLSYAALADAAEALGEHTATGLSAGQRGSKLLGGLPENLQPYICRGGGGYAKGQEWPEVDVDIAQLKKLDFVRPERVMAFVNAFITATAKPVEVSKTIAGAAPEIEAESAPDDSAE